MSLLEKLIFRLDPKKSSYANFSHHSDSGYTFAVFGRLMYYPNW